MPPILHPQAVAFLRDITEHPDDDAPRLIYADWLTEQGAADSGEFIRLQVELERLPEDDPRYEKVRKRAGALERILGKAWLPAALLALNGSSGRKQIQECKFRRGFLDSVLVQPRRAGVLTALADALALEPLRELRLDCGGGRATLEGVLAELAATPYLGSLRALDLRPSVSGEVLRALVGTPLGRRLTGLCCFVGEGQGAAILQVLTTAPGFPAVAELKLLNPHLGDEGMALLAASPLLANLKALELWHDDYSLDDSIGARGMTALVGSPLWPRLERLSLSRCGIGDNGARVIVEELPRSGLRELHLHQCGLTAVTARRLVALESWGRLEVLDLRSNGDIGEAGTEALAGCPRLTQLRRLGLAYCGTEGATRLFVTSPHAAGLRRIELTWYNVSQKVLTAVKRHFGRRLH